MQWDAPWRKLDGDARRTEIDLGEPRWPSPDRGTWIAILALIAVVVLGVLAVSLGWI